MIEVEAILALNKAHETKTSPLDRSALKSLLENAFYCETADAGKDGFLIAFDQNADYESANFRWFTARYDRFVYVDRVVVAAHARGQGLARAFYAALFDRARAAGHVRVVCEVNLVPPNPGSIAFHNVFGFREVGQAILENGKTVSYQECMT